ncbi:hypothetical protein CPB86DRAFT_784744, partial [Serendipita vermifera]
MELTPTDDFSLFSIHHTSPPFKLKNVIDLPWELTRQIFLTFAQCESNHSILGLICQSWRQVYIETPQLWTRIQVFPSRPIDRDEVFTLQETLIKRSGDLLVDLVWSLPCCELHQEPKRELEERLLNAIPLSRWQSLTICTITPFTLLWNFKGKLENLQYLFIDIPVSESFLSAINSSARCLKLIRFSPLCGNLYRGTRILDKVIDEHTTLQTRVVWNSFLITTLVRYLEVDTLGGFTQPLTQLASFHVRNYDYYGPRTNLSSLLPNLADLKISQCIYTRGITFTSMSLPNLLTLTVGGPDLFILCYFDAPKLENLSITPGMRDVVNINSLEQAMDSPSYQLSPESLSVAFPLNFLCLYHLLSFSPRTKTLSVTGDVDLLPQLPSLLSRKRSMTLSNGQRTEKLDFVEGLEVLCLRLSFIPTPEQSATAKQIASNLMTDPLRSSLMVSNVRWVDCDGFRVVREEGHLRI